MGKNKHFSNIDVAICKVSGNKYYSLSDLDVADGTLMYGDAKEFMRLNPGKVAHCKKYCGDNMRVDTYTDVKQFSLHLKEKSRQYSLFDYMII